MESTEAFLKKPNPFCSVGFMGQWSDTLNVVGFAEKALKKIV